MMLDEKQAKKAIHALYKHNETRSSNDLLESQPYLWLEIVTKKLTYKKSSKRTPVPLRHSVLPDTADVCLIVAKDKEAIQKKLKEEGVGQIKEVISKDELKTKYKQIGSLRKLASSYDMFLVDKRLSPSDVDGMLHGTFLKQNKSPIACKVATSELKSEMEKMLRSTTIPHSNGSMRAVKFGNLSMSEKHALENLTDAVPKLIKEWDNVQALRVKLDKSPSLPIYTSLAA